MGKEPSFQFYPGDWLKDPALRACSSEARSLWIDLLCLMFECEERGVLASGGVPWTDDQISGAVSGDTHKNLLMLQELLRMGVARRNSATAIFSKRMILDEIKRKKWRKIKELQRSDENPVHHDVHYDVQSMSRPSSSSSSSSPLKINTNTKSKDIGDSLRSPPPPKFQPPGVWDIFAYMEVLGVQNASTEAQKFLDHHAQRGWHVSAGRGPIMRDWKAAVRTWRSNIAKFGGGGNEKRTNSERRAEVTKESLRRVFGGNHDVASSVQSALPAGDRAPGGDGLPGDTKELFRGPN